MSSKSGKKLTNTAIRSKGSISFTSLMLRTICRRLPTDTSSKASKSWKPTISSRTTFQLELFFLFLTLAKKLSKLKSNPKKRLFKRRKI